MDYDDQHYSDVNPDTLDLQDPAEVMLTVWAALRPCREVTAQKRNQESNPWIKWAEPKKWNPDCGFEVFTSGKHFGKTKFATVAFNIVGNNYEIFVQRRFHDVVLVFSTRDDGPVLSPQARLKAAVSKMSELTKYFDLWSRNQELEQNFRPEWIGVSASTIFKTIIARKYLEKEWTSGSWRKLAWEVTTAKFVRPQDDIEFCTDALMRKKGFSWPVAASVITFRTFIYLALALSLCSVIILFADFWLSSNSYFDRLHVHWVTTWRAVEGIFSPSQFENVRSWFDSLIGFPLFVGVSVIVIGIILASATASVRYATAIFRFFAALRG